MQESVRFTCADCGGEAAEISINLPANEARGSLGRMGFYGNPTIYGDPEVLAEIFERIHRGELDGISASEAEFLSFFCRACKATYCENCWRTTGIEFDEGFYDYTKATCPKGHEQIVDD